ncbi:MAG: LolA family protein [Gammaproteobacteria bacterium]
MKNRFFVLALIPTMAWAGEAVLSDVLARIQHPGAAKYQYQEIQSMELLDVPAQSEGYMLTDAAGTLVKLQLQPKRVIMAIAGHTMFYWDPELNQRRSAPLSYGGSAVQQISIFRAILNGRIGELQTQYDLAAERNGTHWLLRLIPKSTQANSDISNIEISGDMEDKQRRIEIHQAEGESTEYRVNKIGGDTAEAYSIAGLLKEATGD